MASEDYTWDAVEQFHWCFAEVNAAIVCACAPALKSFFVRYLPGLLSSQFRRQDYDKKSSEQSDLNAWKSPATQSYSSCQPSKDIYEMQWHEDVREDLSLAKDNANDDETSLWKGETGNKYGVTRICSAAICPAPELVEPMLCSRPASPTACPERATDGRFEDTTAEKGKTKGRSRSVAW